MGTKLLFFRRRFFLPLFLLFSLLTLHLKASSPFIRPEELHEGMVGYGLTVFHGTEAESFKVVVLGVLKKALPDSDMILVRLESPYLKKKGIGLVAGMSGSPVYFNGKLAGAIAYGWAFTPEPVAGITPIEAMLRSSKETQKKESASGFPKAFHLPGAVNAKLGGKTAQIPLSPLPIPVSGTGFDPSELQRLQTFFPMLLPVPGGSAVSLAHAKSASLKAGQSLGAALMEGDMSLMATGTLTYREGSKFLAFGHPFIFLGDVDIPLYQSYVHYVLPSIQLPTKFASPLQEVGRVSQDRFFGISGAVGQRAKMVPMDITVYDEERNYLHKFHVKIIRHPDFTPRLAAMAIEQAILSTSKLVGGATAHLQLHLDFEGHPSIQIKNAVFSDQSIPTVTSAEALKPMLRVLENDFEKVNLQKISVHIAIQPELAAATIQRVALSKHHLKPGEPLSLSVFLKPYNGKTFQKTFNFRLPSDVQGTVQVGVAGGDFEDQLRKLMLQPLPDPLNVDQIIGQIQDAPSNNSLVIRMTFPRRSINWAGEDLGNMPQPYADLLKAAGTNPLLFHADGTESRYDMPWVILGSDIEEITVEGKANPSQGEKTPSLPSFPGPSLPLPPPLEEPTSALSTPEPLPSPSLSLPPFLPSVPETEENKTNTQTLESLQDWQEGTLHNLSISTSGDLTLSPTVAPLSSFDENVLWSLTSSNGIHYIGTGNPGKIYQINKEHEKKLFFDPHAVAVLSLAVLPKGELLAGVTGGRLLWLSREGTLKHEWRIPENYIWKILPVQNTVYLATGSPGRIYKLTTESENPEPEVFYTSSQSHILSLYPWPDGKLYAGTANNGLLLEIQPDGTAKTLYDLDEQAILSLTGDANGNLFIGTSGKGKVYLYKQGNGIRIFAELPDKEVPWLGTQKDKILAATGIPARLYAISSKGKLSLLWDGKPDERVAFGGDPDGNNLYVSGNSAALLKITPVPSSRGEFLSKVLDAGAKSQWGKLIWHGQVPADAELLIQTRAGNSAVPDPTWTSWSLPYPMGSSPMNSPPSRYLQIKAALSKSNAGESPRLESLHFFWRPENHPPSISIAAPLSGDVIGPKSSLRGKIRDQDGDTVFFSVSLTKEGKSKKVYSHLYPISKSKGEEDLSVPLNFIHEDGPLELKVTINDSPSNGPLKGLSNEIALKDLTYDSTIPTLTITKIKVAKGALHLEGIANDKTSYIKTVQFRVNGGDWLDTVPASGLFDSPDAPFSLDLDDLSDVKLIEVRALDAAGNEVIVKKESKDLL